MYFDRILLPMPQASQPSPWERQFRIDPGLARTVKNQPGPVAAEERGAPFEGWVLGLLRAYNESGKLYDDIRYWTSANVEVDFLLQRGRKHIAIAAKSTRRIDGSQLAGPRSIADRPTVSRRIVVYPGRLERVTEDGIEILPVDAFVELLDTARL